MLKSSSMIIPKSVLIKIKYIGKNNFQLWIFGPLSIVKLTLAKINSFLNYYRLLIVNFNFLHSLTRKKMAYSESVAHLLKFSFINTNKSYMCYMRIKGVGYKIEQKLAGLLVVTLGYSHKINIKIPQYIKICILKKRTIIWSYSLVKLQKFCFMLTSLRRRDPYNGKGIVQPHLQKKLKIGKISRV